MDWLERLDTPPRIDGSELIDEPDPPIDDLRRSMGDVRNANRYLGGSAVVTRQIKEWMNDKRVIGSKRPLTLLDIATGTADIPHGVAIIAAGFGMTIKFVGLDASEPILHCAKEQIAPGSSIRLVRGDAFHLPFADESVDFALCSLAFHHFGIHGSIVALREMERVSRMGWLVNDLRRARSAWYLIRIVSTLAGMNRMTRHDGPASILRAYSVPEYAEMLEAIGLRPGIDCSIRRSLFYRVALIRSKVCAP